jgi:hypothetical protein
VVSGETREARKRQRELEEIPLQVIDESKWPKGARQIAMAEAVAREQIRRRPPARDGCGLPFITSSPDESLEAVNDIGPRPIRIVQA